MVWCDRRTHRTGKGGDSGATVRYHWLRSSHARHATVACVACVALRG